MGKGIGIGLLTLVMWLGTGVGTRAEQPITIYAAASLTNAINDIAGRAEQTGLPSCRCVYAASSALARQIANAAPVDIFISANREWVDYAVAQGALLGASRRIVARNRLILIAPAMAPFQLSSWKWPIVREALNGGWLALGDPDHVPAGLYAAGALKNMGLWSHLAPRLARAANARAALALVARGEAAAGIVYGSDLNVSQQVRLAAEIPVASHPTIEYWAALAVAGTGGRGRDYLAYLQSAPAQARFLAHGFMAGHGS